LKRSGSRVSADSINRSPADTPSGKAGDVLIVEFTLAGRKFTGLNGGPHFQFNEAVSFQIACEDQAEVDRLTDALSAVPEAEQCGWVKDRYGLSWQIVPTALTRLLGDPDPERAKRAMEGDAADEADRHCGGRACRERRIASASLGRGMSVTDVPPARVLVVDDESQIRKFLAIGLRHGALAPPRHARAPHRAAILLDRGTGGRPRPTRTAP
jgi:predicted 3-demethylubiquinone-9 3-methyltransferase (glyoxalase superfamily)